MRRIGYGLLLLLLAGCGTHQQSVTNSAGTQAARIEILWWWMLGILTTIFVIVVGFVLGAVSRRRGGSEQMPEAQVIDSARDRRLSRVILVLVIMVILFEFGFLVASAIVTKYERGMSSKNPVEIQVIGHRWWWEFRYASSQPSEVVVTANELHLPTGVPILIKASSADVIHSFWVPNIAGKRDLIRPYQTSMWLQVDEEGVFRGQCAEFCGHQHAHMAFYVVAEPMNRFQAWLQAQKAPAKEPLEHKARQGRDVFMKSPCVTCHTIRGTDAGSRVGPDLTHVASRSFIAAGTLPNTRSNLMQWIRDSQSVKPGNLMPSMDLETSELESLVAYMQSLK